MPRSFGSDDKKRGDSSWRWRNLEGAAHELVLAFERLARALEAVDDDRLTCQCVPFKVSFALEHSALRGCRVCFPSAITR